MSHGSHFVQVLNDDHAVDLLAAARAFGGHPDATAARAERVDRDGIELVVDRPGGRATTRVGFTEPLADPDGLPAAFADLTRRARAVLAADNR